MKKIIPILTGVCAILCLLAAAGLSVDFLSQSPAKIAKKYATAVLKGNFRQAAKYSGTENAELYGELADYLDENLGYGGKTFKNPKILMGKPVYNEDKTSAKIHFTAIVPEATESDTLKMTNSGNGWRVEE